MRYDVSTEKSFARAVEDVQVRARENGFGTLHVHDLKATLTSKGFPQDRACCVLEVCHPAQADKVLRLDPAMNVALPCRISVYESEGRTWIGMIRPKAMLQMLSNHPELHALADEVETAMVRIIDGAR